MCDSPMKNASDSESDEWADILKIYIYVHTFLIQKQKNSEKSKTYKQIHIAYENDKSTHIPYESNRISTATIELVNDKDDRTNNNHPTDNVSQNYLSNSNPRLPVPNVESNSVKESYMLRSLRNLTNMSADFFVKPSHRTNNTLTSSSSTY